MRSMVEGARVRAPILTFKRAKKLRREMSLPEVLLWWELRGGLSGHRFRRQHPVGPYILDFYCAAAQLAVEIDGAVHDVGLQIDHDIRRDRWLHQAGVRVLRINAKDVLCERARSEALATIVAAAVAPSTASGGPPPPRSGGGYHEALEPNP